VRHYSNGSTAFWWAMAPLDASILFYRGIAMPHARYWQIVLKKSGATVKRCRQ